MVGSKLIGMFISYLMLMLLSFIMLKIKRKAVGDYFTISDYLIIPYVVVFIIQLITCFVLRLTPAPIDNWVYYFVFFIFVVWFDIIGKKITKGTLSKNNNNQFPKKNQNNGYEKTIDIICICCSLYSFIHMAIILSKVSHLYFIVQEQVQAKYTSGLNFYFRLILMLGTVYYFGIKDINTKNIFFGIICFIPNVLTFVKSIIILSCIGVLICKIKKGLRIKIKTALVMLFIGVIVFFGVNLFEMGVYDPSILSHKEIYQFIGAKMAFYFVSGVQSFSQNIQGDFEAFRDVDNVTIVPFNNLLAKFGLSESIRPVTTISQRLWYSETMNRYVASNVNGYVGTLYLFNGFIFGNFINIIWVLISSILEKKYEQRENILSALASLYCAAFTLGWFDYYFSQTFWLYLLFLGYVVNYVAYKDRN